jgi:putative hemolysin
VTNAPQISVLPRLLAFPIPRPIEAALERVLGIRDIGAVYSSLRSAIDERPITERLLQHLEVTHRVAEKDLDHIPRSGAAVLVVNHPFGILEGAVLTTMLAGIRCDVKFLANGVLTAIPEIRDLIIPVDPTAGASAVRRNGGGLRQSLDFLAAGGLLVVFPAGEVSHFQWNQLSIVDPPWNSAVARVLELAARQAPSLTVVPVHIQGANSRLFQLLGLLHPRLRTAMLARELLNKRRAHVSVRIGSAIAVHKLFEIPTDVERMAYLRWRTYLLAARAEYKANMSLPIASRRGGPARVERVVPAIDSRLLLSDVRALHPAAVLAKSGELSACIASAKQIPNVLAEIARLRELAFRAAGEGTGNSSDSDTFDEHYLHLFVWHETRHEVVGAYRLAGTDRVTKQFGLRGLYTATLFRYGQKFLDRMGPALELGRSFIRTEYQRGFAPLLLLWRGIGKYVELNPRYKVLFGPVSISNQYQSISRELMVSFLERHASLRDWVGLVSTRNPFRRRNGHPRQQIPAAGFDIEDLSAVVSDLEPSRAGVPVLLRQYLKLGGKLLGFNVDPKFSDALDGLILVDLTKTEPKLLERYLGKREAAHFLNFHRGAQNAIR